MCQVTFKGTSISLSDYYSAETIFTLERKPSDNQEHWTQQSCAVDKETEHHQGGCRKFSRSGRLTSILGMYKII